MIVFDLECSQGHIFEGWFDSNESFDKQNAQDLVRCPFCDDANVRKVMSPVAVKKSQSVPVPGEETIDYQRLAKEVVEYVKNNSEDVGTRFAAEALKIHYGAAERRSIRGSATADEEKTLKEEGVEFVKIPFPISEDDKNVN
ncbi:MAG: DUF1178 family protein [Deltaproteobacteria bacterium]|nr:DUF1178 family protein [Deltaproteobacteria bacterium]MBW2113094.1 DUF1178 family protein [Deltaproteobacteria bacterium]MBW2352013.1 DUF1178 family protein [Deltaproteobacteria bacterium]HDZ90282.1 DUF1178 family protein [Deltaproteobacteria bacterium]